MKITHLISSLDAGYGGPVVALEGLCRGLQQAADISLEVVSSGAVYGGESVAGRLAEIDINVSESPLDFQSQVQVVQASDLVHVHGVWDPAFHDVITLCRRTNTPYIVRPCGMLDPWSLKQKRFKKWIYRTIRLNAHLRDAAAIHFTTQAEFELANSFCRPGQAIIEPNGVFLDDFTTAPSDELRQGWGIPKDATLALFLGRIHPKKGIEFLIRAFQRRPELNLHLVVAGNGEAEYVRKVASMAADDPRIHFVGMLEGKIKKQSLATADFFVLTSYQENFGNAVVEALASGTPVLISPGVNLVDVVQQRQIGEVVELNEEAIASTLVRWVNSPEMVADYAVRCRTTAGELFDWAAIGKRWVDHYEKLISTPLS
ncbi:Glycosyltransferase involved in cell wall bisynthesis [Neorhodopirellula lusitana]|uniref:Glycosyltransferase involved in cell wall bisynthesis n=1 Tax=Neorhodopirellula lusitana TaxID=445327 RepID=A0ABY1Q7I2_9BACT|nr:glycosyltransferase [Neorhodopirellula lusitana]SMP62092.1 Glycosyltransferase involved in cell wall bisynthesis [Neorhodopirellula lusitana]